MGLLPIPAPSQPGTQEIVMPFAQTNNAMLRKIF